MVKNKTNVIVIIIVFLSYFAVACGTKEAGSANQAGLSNELNVFNWSNYLPASIIEKFEKEYNVKVNYSTYSSNEEMLAKLMTGGNAYDITVATGYTVDLMRKQKLIASLDKNNIPNIKNIGPEYLNQDFDPENTLSLPYMAGTFVIAVDTSKVMAPIEKYEDLWRAELNNSLVVPDDGRAMIGISNKIQGKSLNETDPAVLTKSKELLIKLLPNIKAYDSDSPKTLFLNGEVKAGLVYSSEAFLAMQSKPTIKTIFPKEGMILWMDNFVIPKDAPHKKTAEVFINFLLRPEISAEISKEIPYTNPNMEARKLIDKSILSSPVNYPSKESLEQGEYAKDIGDSIREYDRIWNDVKQSQ